jgi:hypothetical protein
VAFNVYNSGSSVLLNMARFYLGSVNMGVQ